MQTLKNICEGSIFKVPDMTPEQWEEQERRVREWEENQERERIQRRLAASGVPERYRKAVADVPQIAEWADNPTTGLLIQGKTGKGKTHQACGALIRFMTGENDPLNPPRSRTGRFITFDDLLRECKATFTNHDTEEAVIGRYANTGMLLIDDMGKERATEWSLPIIFSIVNKRYMSGKPTIITTQYDGKTLLQRMTVNGDMETGRAIISRMTEYQRVFLDGKDWRL